MASEPVNDWLTSSLSLMSTAQNRAQECGRGGRSMDEEGHWSAPSMGPARSHSPNLQGNGGTEISAV